MLDYGKGLSGSNKHLILRELSIACEARGTDATGFSYFENEKLHIHKAPKSARKMKFCIPSDAHFIMGHTRMTTQGSESKNYNNHPFLGMAGGEAFALAHNGVLHNDIQLRREHHLPATKVETDSYAAVQLLEQSKTVDFASLAQMAEKLEGTFTLTALTEDALYIIKGNNPFCLYHFPTLRIYLYASTEEILTTALARLGLLQFQHEKVDFALGDILRIDTHGSRETAQFDTDKLLVASTFSCWEEYFGFPCEGDTYLDIVCDYARQMGISEKELEVLIDAGYDAMDIEELLYEPALRQFYLSELLQECH